MSAVGTASPYRVAVGRRRGISGTWQCAGGLSAFYGCASVRSHDRVFEPRCPAPLALPIHPSPLAHA